MNLKKEVKPILISLGLALLIVAIFILLPCDEPIVDDALAFCPCAYLIPDTAFSIDPEADKILVLGDSWSWRAPLTGDKCFISGGHIEDISNLIDNADPGTTYDFIIILVGIADMVNLNRSAKDAREAARAMGLRAVAAFGGQAIIADPGYMMSLMSTIENRSVGAYHASEIGYLKLFDHMGITSAFLSSAGRYEYPVEEPVPTSIF